MTWTELLARVQAGSIRVVADSRQVQPGDCFVAVCGAHTDGHRYLHQAAQKGAAYLVGQKAVEGLDVILVENSAVALGILAQAAYGYPNQRLTNLAVTGTNGKTTTTFLVRSVIQTAGYQCGLIGTVVYMAGENTVDAPLTTPDALTLAAAARQMVDAGCHYMVIEASSHALDQDRLAGIHFTAAAFTNLTGDHLDYHGTMEAYLAAKTKLFTSLPPHGIAVLNAHDPASQKIAAQCKRRILWYAVNQPADITAHIHRMDQNGSVFSIEFNQVMEKVHTPLCGLHNVCNHLAAAGLCLAAGFPLSAVAEGLSALRSVPGRLEPVDHPEAVRRGIRILVDYAHTDDALENVLKTIRPLCQGTLRVVFGCGGDRDKTKRPRMARVAQKLADAVYVTSDNPRTEDPHAIIADICAGFDKTQPTPICVQPDRAKAIAAAIADCRAGDIVLIAGKGHETYQIIGTTKYPFSDQKTAAAALEALASPAG